MRPRRREERQVADVHQLAECERCGRTFKGERGVRVHQRRVCTPPSNLRDSDECDKPIPSVSGETERLIARDSTVVERRSDTGRHQQHCITQVSQTVEKRRERLLTDVVQAVEEDQRRQPIKWPSAGSAEWRILDEDLQYILNSRRSGDVEKRLRWLINVCYALCADRFDTVETAQNKRGSGRESRCQRRLREVRAEKKKVKKLYRKARPEEKDRLQAQWNALKKRHRELRRAEERAEKRRKAEWDRRAFCRNPFRFVKGLLNEGKSGVLEVRREELESHLRTVYSDENRRTNLAEMPGLTRPTVPGVPFDCGELKWHEVRDFVQRAKATSAPGQNGLSFKFFKKCPSALRELWRILRVLWRREIVPQSWCRAEGVYIPKEQNATKLGQFRPISLLNVDGKIFFGVVARRITDFVMANGFINCSVQKAGVPGFPGCLEHCQMIWQSIKAAKRTKKNLDVVWLDLANAYGSVPHRALWFAMSFFHFPEKVVSTMRAYYEKFVMRFSTKTYTTSWQPLEVGIPMGCTVSPVLFVLAMEVLIRGAQPCFPEVSALPGRPQPALRAFMDDITILSQSSEITERGLARLQELVKWMGMKFKAKKCRSLSIKRGRVTQQLYNVNEERIPTLKEEPVKSLGRQYQCSLNDKSKGREMQEQVQEMLDVIDKTGL